MRPAHTSDPVARAYARDVHALELRLSRAGISATVDWAIAAMTLALAALVARGFPWHLLRQIAEAVIDDVGYVDRMAGPVEVPSRLCAEEVSARLRQLSAALDPHWVCGDGAFHLLHVGLERMVKTRLPRDLLIDLVKVICDDAERHLHWAARRRGQA